MDAEKEAYQGLWRKALEVAETLQLPCKSVSEATRIRLMLYRAVKDVRTGKEQADKRLMQAVQELSIGFAPDSPTTVVFRRKLNSELLSTITEILGGEVRTKEDFLIQDSFEAVQAKLANPPSPEEEAVPAPRPRSTPYYTREK